MRGLIAQVLLLLCCAGAAQAQGWQVRYSKDVVLKAPAPGQEFAFDFPLPTGSVHYITRPVTLSASRRVSASFTISAQDAPAFDGRIDAGNTCDKPAAVRLFLQRQGDDMSGRGPFEFYRWWSNAGSVLKDGTGTLEVGLEPTLWTSVFGKTGDRNPAAFADAIAHLGQAGVTFGGGCFYGHGVRVLNGGATFRLTRFEVE